MEDVVEEIFGEIEDEHDKLETTEKELGKGEYEFSARLEIDYINEKYNLGLPADDEQYDTLGGLILHLYGDIPEEGEQISFEQFSFIPLIVSETRVEPVKLTVND